MSILKRLEGNLSEKMAANVADRICKAHKNTYINRRVEYTSLCLMVHENKLKNRIFEGKDITDEAIINDCLPSQEFGDFDDPHRFNGFSLHPKYLLNAYKEYFKKAVITKDAENTFFSKAEVESMLSRENLIHRSMQLIDGKTWSGDGSFKFVARITIGDNDKPVYQLYSILNEYNEVIFQKPVYSGRQKHAKLLSNPTTQVPLF